VESRLTPGTECSVIVELAAEANHVFIPITRGAAPSLGRASSFSDDSSEEGSCCGKVRAWCSRMFRASNVTSGETSSQLEYFRAARYVTGQLFVGDMVTSLVANTFYNPSLHELVSTMINATVHMESVPARYEGRSFFEFFSYLLWEERLFAIGLMRRASSRPPSLLAKIGSPSGGGQQRRFAFVYTAPPMSDTVLLATDRVICFGPARQRPTSTGSA